jgi:Tfp pilus assembly protein PilF
VPVRLPLLIPVFLAAPLAPPADGARSAYERGRRLYEQGDDMAAARAALDEAVRLDATLAEAYLYRALVREDVGGLADARGDFERALALAPGSREVQRRFGDALAAAGDLTAAEQRYRRALEIDSGYGEAWYQLGRLHRSRGQLDQAIACFEKDAALEPTGAAHHELAEIFLLRRDDARAASELQADLRADPSCYDSRLALAGLALERRDFAGARDQYRISLGYHPADARALSGLGRAYLALGDYEMAVGTLRQAQELAPGDARVGQALATARRRLRLRYGWPFALVPAAIAAVLGARLIRARCRRAAPAAPAAPATPATPATPTTQGAS